jgi:hypothetical protein
MLDLRANALRLLEEDTVTANWQQIGAQFCVAGSWKMQLPFKGGSMGHRRLVSGMKRLSQRTAREKAGWLLVGCL